MHQVHSTSLVTLVYAYLPNVLKVLFLHVSTVATRLPSKDSFECNVQHNLYYPLMDGRMDRSMSLFKNYKNIRYSWFSADK